MVDHNAMSQERRQFLAMGVAGVAGLVLPARAFCASDIMEVWRLLRLHPVRFMAGLVFDVAEAVFVDLAKDFVVDALVSGNRPTVSLGSTSGTESAAVFRHVQYKASTVVLGVADYEAYRARQLRLLLKDSAQKQRYQAVLTYLRDEKIRIALAGASKSDPVGADTTPDDLFTLDYIQMSADQEQHYRNLLEVTRTTAFDDYRV